VKWVGFVLLFVVLAGCTEEELGLEPEGNSAELEGSTIGYAIPNLNDTFQTMVLDAAEDAAEEVGITLSVENAEEDLIRQQDQVNALIENGVDGLIVIPVDTSAVEPIIEAAQAADTPLVFLNRNPFSSEEEIPEGVYFVGSAEYEAGVMQMEHIGELLEGEGGIGILLGILGNEATVERTDGVKDTINEQFPDIEVLAEESADWQRDQAVSLVENWLLTYGEDINAIVSNNDEMALGALQAIQSNNREDVFVIGVDAISDALQSIEAGELDATMFQDAEGQGQTAIDVMQELLSGGQPEESQVLIPFELVTEENVGEYQ
jgi:inositol transport system substrate-binding protein